MFLNNLEQIRAVGDFARSYLWDVQFPDAPEPFTEWFPANDFEEQLVGLEAQPFEFYLNTYEVPKTLRSPNFTLTLYDHEDRPLLTWFEDWIHNTIFNDGEYVSTLEEAVKELRVAKLKHDKSVAMYRTYWVFPTGDLIDHSSSDSALSLISVSFVVAGRSPLT